MHFFQRFWGVARTIKTAPRWHKIHHGRKRPLFVSGSAFRTLYLSLDPEMCAETARICRLHDHVGQHFAWDRGPVKFRKIAAADTKELIYFDME